MKVTEGTEAKIALDFDAHPLPWHTNVHAAIIDRCGKVVLVAPHLRAPHLVLDDIGYANHTGFVAYVNHTHASPPTITFAPDGLSFETDDGLTVSCGPCVPQSLRGRTLKVEPR